MKSHRLRNTIWIIILLIIVFCIAVLFGAFRTSSVAPQAKEQLSADEMQVLAKKGRELVLAGDCFGCHSQPSGPQAAGGVPIDTPFGTLHSTNITPDKKHGIGNYSREDFHRVLRDGIAPGDRNLYPAMPFVFTHITTADDIDAIYAYLMSIEPMDVPNKENTGVFKLPVRPFMNFWTLLNFPDRQVPSEPDRSKVWARGAYLVEGLAHCAACHTPRNLMMGVDFSKNLEGGEVDGLDIPNITPEMLAKRGFDVPTLSQYLETGMAPQGTSFAGMHTVTHFSTSAMEKDDVDAMATYLLTDKDGQIVAPSEPPQPIEAAAHPEPDSDMEVGRRVYMAACAGCHGLEGEGVPNVSPALHGNGIIAMDSPRDTIAVVLNGIPTERFTGYKRMYEMPPFSHRLKDEEVADLVTWVRAEWGGQDTAVTVDDVQAIDKAIH
ncbi:MAG TPA: cytochrome c [Paenalcaligenes sp.]|nr:cytochrome c [Paenalcaligenes sp.]